MTYHHSWARPCNPAISIRLACSLCCAISLAASAQDAASHSHTFQPEDKQPEDRQSEDKALIHAHELLENYPLVDGHNDLPFVIREKGDPLRDVNAYDLTRTTPHDTDFARLHAGHVGAQFWSVYIPGTEIVKNQGFAKTQLEQIDIARRLVEQYPEYLSLATRAEDIEKARYEGRIASLLGMEGGHAIENSLGALRMFYRLGVRYMTLTHFPNNDWADAAGNDVHGGLTRFGEEVVREMNRLGMLVDLSHVSVNTMNDALDVSEAPVIFSHSNTRALTPHKRNVPDQVLKRLPQNGGVVMASFISVFNVKDYAEWEEGFKKASGGLEIGDPNYDEEKKKYSQKFPEPKASISDVADHLEHIRMTAGIDHVALGSDFYGDPETMVTDLEDTASFPLLFAELIRRGWSDEELIKLSRGNLIRVLKAAEDTSERLQKERNPSYATIEQLDQGQEAPNSLR